MYRRKQNSDDFDLPTQCDDDRKLQNKSKKLLITKSYFK